MRPSSKLIRQNCPACDCEITLGVSSLNKKINCPKCLQTVIIPNGIQEPAEKPAPTKTAAKQAARPARGKKPPAVVEEPRIVEPPRVVEETRVIIQAFRAPVPVAAAEETVAPPVDKKEVTYCLCNGTLKKCTDRVNCCCAPAICIYGENIPSF